MKGFPPRCTPGADICFLYCEKNNDILTGGSAPYKQTLTPNNVTRPEIVNRGLETELSIKRLI